MSRAFSEVPVVDISGLSSSDAAQRRATAMAVGRAAREVGFLYVSGHGVDPALLQGLQATAAAFFDQPLDTKMAAYIGGSGNHSGYVPEGEEVFASGKIDRKEAYDVNLDYRGPDSRPMLGPTLWPDFPGFKATAGAYYEAMADLARRLFGAFALALDLAEDHFDGFRLNPPSQLRLIHYPFDPDAAADQQGIGAHTDYECFTILHGTAPGLEVLNGAGQWIDAPPVPRAFVVNIGDMLEAWTNGEFVATSHRVRKVGEERYSFPFFATCDYETVVEPLTPFVSDSRPAAYPRIVSGDHLFAQTAQTFAYLKARRARGELGLPEDARGLSSFGQEARQGEPVG
jgi:isopenicillin N synthase-like dioxygenase